MENLLDIKQLSAMLGVKTATIYGWVHDKYIPFIKLGRLVRFDYAEIMDWVQKQKHTGKNNALRERELLSLITLR